MEKQDISEQNQLNDEYKINQSLEQEQSFKNYSHKNKEQNQYLDKSQEKFQQQGKDELIQQEKNKNILKNLQEIKQDSKDDQLYQEENKQDKNIQNQIQNIIRNSQNNIIPKFGVKQLSSENINNLETVESNDSSPLSKLNFQKTPKSSSYQQAHILAQNLQNKKNQMLNQEKNNQIQLKKTDISVQKIEIGQEQQQNLSESQIQHRIQQELNKQKEQMQQEFLKQQQLMMEQMQQKFIEQQQQFFQQQMQMNKQSQIDNIVTEQQQKNQLQEDPQLDRQYVRHNQIDQTSQKKKSEQSFESSKSEQDQSQQNQKQTVQKQNQVQTLEYKDNNKQLEIQESLLESNLLSSQEPHLSDQFNALDLQIENSSILKKQYQKEIQNKLSSSKIEENEINDQISIPFQQGQVNQKVFQNLNQPMSSNRKKQSESQKKQFFESIKKTSSELVPMEKSNVSIQAQEKSGNEQNYQIIVSEQQNSKEQVQLQKQKKIPRQDEMIKFNTDKQGKKQLQSQDNQGFLSPVENQQQQKEINQSNNCQKLINNSFYNSNDPKLESINKIISGNNYLGVNNTNDTKHRKQDSIRSVEQFLKSQDNYEEDLKEFEQLENKLKNNRLSSEKNSPQKEQDQNYEQLEKFNESFHEQNKIDSNKVSNFTLQPIQSCDNSSTKQQMKKIENIKNNNFQNFDHNEQFQIFTEEINDSDSIKNDVKQSNSLQKSNKSTKQQIKNQKNDNALEFKPTQLLDLNDQDLEILQNDEQNLLASSKSQSQSLSPINQVPQRNLKEQNKKQNFFTSNNQKQKINLLAKDNLNQNKISQQQNQNKNQNNGTFNKQRKNTPQFFDDKQIQIQNEYDFEDEDDLLHDNLSHESKLDKYKNINQQKKKEIRVSVIDQQNQEQNNEIENQQQRNNQKKNLILKQDKKQLSQIQKQQQQNQNQSINTNNNNKHLISVDSSISNIGHEPDESQNNKSIQKFLNPLIQQNIIPNQYQRYPSQENKNNDVNQKKKKNVKQNNNHNSQKFIGQNTQEFMKNQQQFNEEIDLQKMNIDDANQFFNELSDFDLINDDQNLISPISNRDKNQVNERENHKQFPQYQSSKGKHKQEQIYDFGNKGNPNKYYQQNLNDMSKKEKYKYVRGQQKSCHTPSQYGSNDYKSKSRTKSNKSSNSQKNSADHSHLHDRTRSDHINENYQPHESDFKIPLYPKNPLKDYVSPYSVVNKNYHPKKKEKVNFIEKNKQRIKELSEQYKSYHESEEDKYQSKSSQSQNQNQKSNYYQSAHQSSEPSYHEQSQVNLDPTRKSQRTKTQFDQEMMQQSRSRKSYNHSQKQFQKKSFTGKYSQDYSCVSSPRSQQQDLKGNQLEQKNKNWPKKHKNNQQQLVDQQNSQKNKEFYNQNDVNFYSGSEQIEDQKDIMTYSQSNSRKSSSNLYTFKQGSSTHSRQLSQIQTPTQRHTKNQKSQQFEQKFKENEQQNYRRQKSGQFFEQNQQLLNDNKVKQQYRIQDNRESQSLSQNPKDMKRKNQKSNYKYNILVKSPQQELEKQIEKQYDTQIQKSSKKKNQQRENKNKVGLSLEDDTLEQQEFEYEEQNLNKPSQARQSTNVMITPTRQNRLQIQNDYNTMEQNQIYMTPNYMEGNLENELSPNFDYIDIPEELQDEEQRQAYLEKVKQKIKVKPEHTKRLYPPKMHRKHGSKNEVDVQILIKSQQKEKNQVLKDQYYKQIREYQTSGSKNKTPQQPSNQLQKSFPSQNNMDYSQNSLVKSGNVQRKSQNKSSQKDLQLHIQMEKSKSYKKQPVAQESQKKQNQKPQKSPQKQSLNQNQNEQKDQEQLQQDIWQGFVDQNYLKTLNQKQKQEYLNDIKQIWEQKQIEFRQEQERIKQQLLQKNKIQENKKQISYKQKLQESELQMQRQISEQYKNSEESQNNLYQQEYLLTEPNIRQSMQQISQKQFSNSDQKLTQQLSKKNLAPLSTSGQSSASQILPKPHYNWKQRLYEIERVNAVKQRRNQQGSRRQTIKLNQTQSLNQINNILGNGQNQISNDAQNQISAHNLQKQDSVGLENNKKQPWNSFCFYSPRKRRWDKDQQYITLSQAESNIENNEHFLQFQQIQMQQQNSINYFDLNQDDYEENEQVANQNYLKQSPLIVNNLRKISQQYNQQQSDKSQGSTVFKSQQQILKKESFNQSSSSQNILHKSSKKKSENDLSVNQLYNSQEQSINSDSRFNQKVLPDIDQQAHKKHVINKLHSSEHVKSVLQQQTDKQEKNLNMCKLNEQKLIEKKSNQN